MNSTPLPATPPPRLLALDVLRGLTIAAMILVTDPGTYSHVYPQLLHAVWNGPTAADLIFPCFLVIVGVSVTLSMTARLERGGTFRALVGHAARRSAVLIAVGLFFNGFPFFDLAHLRVPGVLQRIGICYFFGSLLFLMLRRLAFTTRARQRTLALVCCGSLGVYWVLLEFYPTPGFGPGRLDSLGSLPAVLDRALFTVPHLWIFGTTPGWGVTFDPEGALSTLGAFGTTLLGVLAGEVLRSDADEKERRRQCATLAVGGTGLWLAGLGLGYGIVLNKKIWTPSFALWSAGLSILLLAGLLYLIDIRRCRRGWTLPLIFGTNAILAYVLSGLITTVLNVISVRTPEGKLGLYTFLSNHVFATWLPPRPASLAYALVIVLLNAALVYPLYRRRMFLRL